MGCAICNAKHNESYHLKSKLTDSGYPTHSKKYKTAHEEASKDEKKDFPRGYEKLKKMDYNAGKHELLGKHIKSGEIEVSKKVPPKLRKEVAFHEHDEKKRMTKK